MAEANVSVTIIGRDETSGSEIINEMKRRSPLKDNDAPKFEFIKCDASLLTNVKICAEQYKQTHSSLDMLILSQGIASIDGYTPTSEGIERKLALHYYSRIGFIKCLLPLMVSTSSCPQVLSVLSAGIHSPYEQYKADPDLKENFSIKNAADAAGFYNDIALDMLSKQFPAVSFIHSAPGAVRTNWGSEFPWYIRGPLRAIQFFFMSTEDCAEYQCANLFNSEMQHGGFFLRSQSGTSILYALL